MVKKKQPCDHFWELDFPVQDWENPKWICMKCGKTKHDSIPILDLEKLEKEI